MKKTNWKRWTRGAWLVAVLVMIFCCGMTTSASAKTVAQIGSRKYSSIQKAVSAVKSGQTIVLKSNIDMKKKKLTLSRNVTYAINLNKKKITNCAGIDITKGKVTIKNGQVQMVRTYHMIVVKKGTLTVSQLTYNSQFEVKKAGVLNIKSGNYTKWCLDNYGKTTISGGTFKKVYPVGNMGTFIINGGTFSFIPPMEMGIQLYNEGIIKIYKGKLKTKCCLVNDGGSIKLSKSADKSWKKYLIIT